VDGGAQRRGGGKREEHRAEVACARNEVEINANLREEPGHKARQGTTRIRGRKGPRRNPRKGTTDGRGGVGAVEGRREGGSGRSRCRERERERRGRTRKLRDGRRWRHGRLINFFAFFDPHKLCRRTWTGKGSPRALKGSGSFCRASRQRAAESKKRERERERERERKERLSVASAGTLRAL